MIFMIINLQENITTYLQEKNIIQNYPSSEYGVICESENEIAAYLYYSINHYHPSTIYLRFAILDKDIESETLIEMYDKFDTVLPSSNIIFQIHRNFDFYEHFINARDFVEFKKTYEPEVDIHSLLSGFSDNVFGEQYTSEKFKMTERLLETTKEVYQSTHEVNPLKNMDLSEWKGLLTDDLDFENSIVIHDQRDEIVAYTMIYENEDTSKDVGYCYFKDQNAKQALSAEFYKTLIHLQETNFTHLNLEVDSTDQYSFEFFNRIIEDKTPALITFIKKKND